MTEALLILTLPVTCPEPGCGTWLQRCLQPDQGVRPHYTTCHPDKAVPLVEVER